MYAFLCFYTIWYYASEGTLFNYIGPYFITINGEIWFNRWRCWAQTQMNIFDRRIHLRWNCMFILTFNLLRIAKFLYTDYIVMYFCETCNWLRRTSELRATGIKKKIRLKVYTGFLPVCPIVLESESWTDPRF